MAVNCRVLQGGVCSITQPYHINGQKGYKYDHWGIDLTGWNGSYNVLDWCVAHSDGEVVDIRTNCTGFESNSYGNYVLLKHANGYYTMYAHLAYGYVKVSYGQKVTKGQVIGYMDNTGTSYGGHLHWEVRQPNGYKIDPEPYLNRPLPGMGGWVEYINGEWVYVKDGKIDYSYNGVAQNENGWWKIKNGKVDFSFTGLAKNEYGWWYCENGKVNFTYNGIVKNEYGWWKVTNGKVDFTYNGLAKNENGWWMLQGGKVDFDYNGLCCNEYGTWVLVEGKVNFDYVGKYVFSGKVYNIEKGKVV